MFPNLGIPTTTAYDNQPNLNYKIYHLQQILSKLSGKKCIVVHKYIRQYVFSLFLTDLLKRKKYNLKFLVTVTVKMFIAKYKKIMQKLIVFFTTKKTTTYMINF